MTATQHPGGADRPAPRPTDAGPLPDVQRHARVAGLMYVALFILGPMVFLGGKAAAFVPGDPAATAEALRAIGPSGIRAALGIEALIFLIEVVLAAILYVLFRPVQRAIALASTLARFGEAVVQGANLLPGILLVSLLGGSAYASTLPPEQVEGLLHLFLEANDFMVLVWGLFFGLHVVLLAWLVHASGFLPRWLGVLLGFAGVGYLAQSFGVIVWPESAGVLDQAVVVMAVPGELAFTLWLLIRGVDAEAWEERARSG